MAFSECRLIPQNWILSAIISLLALVQPAQSIAQETLRSDTTALQTTRKEVHIDLPGFDLNVTLHLPSPFKTHAPAVILLPGLMADVDQYDSYGQSLAAKGMIVAVHPWYSPLTSDVELARNAKLMRDWLVNAILVDSAQIGIAGHSMGAKDAILAAGLYPDFAAVVAIDPDDSGDVSAVDSYVPHLITPLLLIGAEMGWDAPDICAPIEENYQRFFERSPFGTIELILKDADHVQMLDDPERFGYTICRSGTADSRRVHDDALQATVGFFVQHLQSGPMALSSMPKEHTRIKGLTTPLLVSPANIRRKPY